MRGSGNEMREWEEEKKRRKRREEEEDVGVVGVDFLRDALPPLS